MRIFFILILLISLTSLLAQGNNTKQTEHQINAKLIGEPSIVHALRINDKKRPKLVFTMHYYTTKGNAKFINTKQYDIQINKKKYDSTHGIATQTDGFKTGSQTGGYSHIDEFVFYYDVKKTPELATASEVNFIYEGEICGEKISINKKMKINE